MNHSDADSPLDGLCDTCVQEWRTRSLSRRDFAALSVAVGASIATFPAAGQNLNPPPDAPGMSFNEFDVEIKTSDGTMDAAFIRPATGEHPGVILWPDIGSLREALRFYGRRLAAAGYAVVIPNVYYRVLKAPLWNGPSNLSPESWAMLQKGLKSTSVQTYMTDAHAIMSYLESQSAVSKDRKMGVLGYCMGGPPVMRSAAWFPERIGAAGIYHGGGLVTKAPDSPHLLIPQMKARFDIGIAETDDRQMPTVKDALRTAFAAAHLRADIAVYPGTAHGWTTLDFPPTGGSQGFDDRGHYAEPAHLVYDPIQAERAFGRLLGLYKSELA